MTSPKFVRLFFVAALVVGLSGLTALRAAPGTQPPVQTYVLSAADNQLLDEIQRSGFMFFQEQAHPRTGLVRDRARADGSPSQGKASISASGFALGAWVIATERGWVDRPAALARIRLMLRFLAEKAPRHHGFFYHFMEMDTGARAWVCELSSIDSALLYAGLIVAREYFADPEITALANRLLGDVDWTWFRNGGRLVSLSWHDESGFSRHRWNKFSEHVLMSYLSLGVSARPLEADYWRLWTRAPVGRYRDSIYLQEPPLFINQFPLAFIDVKDRRDAFADYHYNARLATLAQRQFSIDLRREFPAWGENLWGLTASDSVTGYKAWGGPPRTLSRNSLDGTVVPCAPAGSLPFAPAETLAVLHHMREAYGARIWQRYGFVDAFNPQTGWVNPDVIGIDVGISVLQAENLRTGLIQRLFMRSPEAQLALAKAGLLSTARVLDPSGEAQVRSRAAAAWHQLQSRPAAAGLQLTALLAARELGLLPETEFLAAARSQLAVPAAPDTAAVAEYAAALLTLRQAVPALAPEATRLLEAVRWQDFPAAAPELGAASRLAVFLQVGAGVRPPTDWAALNRATQTLGPVKVLAPADPAGAVLPGLWLREREILSGASASQLAYASLTDAGVPASEWLPALQLEHFPRESVAATTAFRAPVSPEAAAAYLITAANLLGHDAIRRAFQQDPLVQAGRTALAEFAEAAFGPNTSITAQRELSITPPPPPRREITAVSAQRPRDQWDWQLVQGMEFKDTDADVLPDDPPLHFRFAVTWDAQALHFHAEVTDNVPGFPQPAVRNRIVELFIDPAGDGLIWSGPEDYQFSLQVGIPSREVYNQARHESKITLTPEGYTVEATVPWTSLGLAPRPGLEFGLSAAAISEGVKEWEPMLKLNWSCVALGSGQSRLGRIRLQ